jgi:hypothetical protein
MKRNLLLLAVMVTMVFGFYSLSAAQQDPNDNGAADSLVLEAFCGDTALGSPGATQMRVPMYVTNDIPDPAIDSIAAFVIPLCFTYSNAAAQCTIDPYYNNTDLYPFPTTDRSIFRHLDCDGTPVTNWMMALSESLTGKEWDTRILDLGDQHFWLALFPTGSPDQRFSGGEHVLLATITFDLQDSTMLCIDSCFWPPASHLAFSRSDAVTYVPRTNMPWCHDYYIIPDIPPVFTTCPTSATHKTNGHFAQNFVAEDEDGDVVSVGAAYTGDAGITNVTISYTAAPPAATVEGAVEYDVVDHCLDGGTITLTCTDNQGVSNTIACEKVVTLDNDPPTINAGADKTGPYNVQLCSDAITTSDVNSDAVTWVIAGVAPTPDGTIQKLGDQVCFDATCLDVCITYTVTVEATDACGATATDDVTFHVTNDPPEDVFCPSDQSLSAGDEFTSTDYGATDPEGEAMTWEVCSITPTPTNMPYFNGPVLTWQSDMADPLGDYEICIRPVDQCGETIDPCCCFTVTLVFKQDYVEIGNYDCAEPGEYVSLPVYLVNNTVPFGGFELEFEFDYTSMCFVDVDPGDCFVDPYTDVDGFYHSWEYFTYRMLPCPIPPCQKYKILVYGQAEIPNGAMNLGECIPAGQDCVLLYLNFVVMNNQNLRGFMIPVCFEWEGTVVDDVVVEDWECTENTFASCDGNTLYTSSLLCEFNPDVCDDPGGAIEQIMTFQQPICGFNCGGVLVCPAGPDECKRGDVNMNTVSYEVADAVLFANYFVYGTGVFIHDMAYQICATDANADGRTLTLSDLVYLIRVILHDAVEMPKLAPASEVANVIVSNNTITVDCAAPIAVMLFEFDGAIQPTMLADMEMVHNGNKVLVWSRNGNTLTTAEVLSFSDAELVSVSAVDYDTRALETSITAKVAPSAFALHPAYPNPFNPATNLSFTLPEAASYSLNIYNVAGQLVRSYSGVGSTGLNVVTWDGKDNAGVEVSSGVYFYKLMASGFSATEKMVMMK